MKHTYRIHPENYDVGRMERFYSRMAAKGWRLEKRGPYLSRFRRADPENLMCRIELSGVEQEILIRGGVFDPDEFAAFFKAYSNGTMHPRIWREEADQQSNREAFP